MRCQWSVVNGFLIGFLIHFADGVVDAPDVERQEEAEMVRERRVVEGDGKTLGLTRLAIVGGVNGYLLT